jgi:hypothetical protein
MSSPQPRRRSPARLALGLVATVVGVGLVACAGSSDGARPDTTTTRADDPSSATAAPPPDALDVAVVADSEVPAEVIDGLDARDDIHVTSRVAQPGWTIEQLDPAFDEALDARPDVLVYSAGANNLLTTGIGGTLDELQERVDRAKAATCLVYVLPSADTSSLAEPSRTQADDLLSGFGDVTAGWGVAVVSYPDIAAAMAADGDRFYAEGELGGFHPGPQSYERIIDAIAEEVDTCR